MPSVQKLKLAALLYRFCFPVYRWLYLSCVSLIPKAVAAESGTLKSHAFDMLNVDHRTYQTSDYKIKY